jgi:hypothetical protein
VERIELRSFEGLTQHMADHSVAADRSTRLNSPNCASQDPTNDRLFHSADEFYLISPEFRRSSSHAAWCAAGQVDML